MNDVRKFIINCINLSKTGYRRDARNKAGKEDELIEIGCDVDHVDKDIGYKAIIKKENDLTFISCLICYL